MTVSDIVPYADVFYILLFIGGFITLSLAWLTWQWPRNKGTTWLEAKTRGGEIIIGLLLMAAGLFFRNW